MDRVDLFTTVHKGLRVLLFETTRLVARTDFADDHECSVAVVATTELLRWLDEHSAHEDAVIMPRLSELAPELHSALAAEHARVDGLAHVVKRLLPRFSGADTAQRIALGVRLHRRLGRLTAEHLAHMEREETEANRVLWAHIDDASLAALRGRILASIAPARLAAWLGILLPAVSPAERAGMIAGLRTPASETER
jgi:hypothetical protein